MRETRRHHKWNSKPKRKQKKKKFPNKRFNQRFNNNNSSKDKVEELVIAHGLDDFILEKIIYYFLK